MLVFLLSCFHTCREPSGPQTAFADHLEACETTEDCLSGLVCAGDDLCRYPGEPGTSAEGDDCLSSSYCLAGLACNSEGICAQEGSPGTAGVGEACEATDDCALGYACVEGVCYGFDIPLWFGEECPDEEEGAFRVLHEVATDGDFYREPFPNDGRIAPDGSIDLSTHPAPGVLIEQLGDVVGDTLNATAEDFEGWGTNSAIFFRFSQTPAFSTLSLEYGSEAGTVGILDVTEGAEEYGELHAPAFRAASARGLYICQDWIAVRPSSGFPLDPGHTYAAFIRSTVEADDGSAPAAQDEDLAALLSETAPSPSRLSDAWEAYAPFRDWLATTGNPASDYAGVAVFTVQDPTAPADMLRAAVEDLDAPQALGLHLCENDTGAGPYAFGNDDDLDRGCHGESELFHELQGRVTLAQFQRGTVPFKEASDGGAIEYADGAAVPVRNEDVTFSLTVPKGEMPADGWPVVVYGHGTDGNYREGVVDGTADALSSVVLDDGTEVAFAVLTIDAVLHGPRRGEENWQDSWLAIDPNAYGADVLFYNPLNPRAARDNALQSAADHWQLIGMLEGWELSAEDSPTFEAIAFDLDELHYMGHSQGATAGPLTVAYEPAFRSAVFSAAGGLLVETLLNKTSPYDIPTMIRVGLADPDIDRSHPLLNIVQMGAERADGVNHARYLHRDESFSDRQHVFQMMGVGDTYTPDEAQEPLARATGMQQVTNGNAAVSGLTEVSPPVQANAQGVTSVLALYEAAGGKDAHFVLFTRDDAARQAFHFLGTAYADEIPTVVEP